MARQREFEVGADQADDAGEADPAVADLLDEAPLGRGDQALARVGQPALGGRAVDVVDPREVGRAEALDRVEAEHGAILGVELGERGDEGGLEVLAVVGLEQEELGIVGRVAEAVERVVVVDEVGGPIALAALAVDPQPHRRDLEPRAQRAAAGELGDPRRLAGLADEQALAQHLPQVVAAAAVGSEAAEGGRELAGVAALEGRDRVRVAGPARERQVEVVGAQRGDLGRRLAAAAPRGEGVDEAAVVDVDAGPGGAGGREPLVQQALEGRAIAGRGRARRPRAEETLDEVRGHRRGPRIPQRGAHHQPVRA